MGRIGKGRREGRGREGGERREWNGRGGERREGGEGWDGRGKRLMQVLGKEDLLWNPAQRKDDDVGVYEPRREMSLRNRESYRARECTNRSLKATQSIG